MQLRATCTLSDKRGPLSTVQCEKWPHAADETIRRAPTTSRYDNIAKSRREYARARIRGQQQQQGAICAGCFEGV